MYLRVCVGSVRLHVSYVISAICIRDNDYYHENTALVWFEAFLDTENNLSTGPDVAGNAKY